MAYFDLKTKPCPFCAETIQAQAVKCRFCGEFLNTAKARALQSDSEAESPGAPAEDVDDGILFACRPSIWGMLPGFIKAALLVVLAGLIMKFPIENIINNRLGLELSTAQILLIGRYRFFVGLALAAVIVLAIIVKAINLKMNYYEICAERIEWSRGLLDRKVDNLDMFRVIDLKLRRNPLDCILGIGTVVLLTSDKTDPEFVFKKIRNSRDLYDIIKKASLEADRRTGVVHLE